MYPYSVNPLYGFLFYTTHIMKKIISIGFILFGLALGYVGYTKIKKSDKSLNIGKIELSVQNSESKTEAYLFIGGGILSVLLGIGGFSNVRLKK